MVGVGDFVSRFVPIPIVSSYGAVALVAPPCRRIFRLYFLVFPFHRIATLDFCFSVETPWV